MLLVMAVGCSKKTATCPAVPYQPSGEVFENDRDPVAYSPDCKWVLMLQDHYGPYHLLEVAGSAKAIIGIDGGSVHSDARWISATELEFFASCCGGVEVYRASVTRPAPQRVYFAPEAPHGIRRLADGGYEKQPTSP